LNPELIRRVWQRAKARCEYCQLPARLHPAPFQIDHIIARQHGGPSLDNNLALACIHCNRFKGPNIAGRDSETGDIIRLFNPRTDTWSEHLEWTGPELKGLTQIGRVTVTVLSMNAPEVIALRKALADEGVFSGNGF
jgi:HNH endonuclease